ncbi:MAG: hypothetical protein GOMPHAMPRED_007818 [Gomphillus americanus]|uniref:Uncharacterized protein n=1 Tax=Gomphillus americanus TaxID=1940652 RepID=A0A8H3EVK8_9LECA|nr:MAG: hypothetical protein GOMPHAMPRED_007818 [Gomphillus americanus]
MKYCLFIGYCTACVANAVQCPRSLPGNLDLSSLPRSHCNEEPPVAAPAYLQRFSQQRQKIPHENILSARGIPPRSDVLSKEKSSNSIDGNGSSGFDTPSGQKGNGPLNIKQRKPVNPLPEMNGATGLKPGPTAPLSPKALHRSSAKLIVGGSKDGRKPGGRNPSPPPDKPEKRRSRTPPARASVAVKGPAVAYVRSPASAAQYFPGNTEAWSVKEISHSREALAGGHMFRHTNIARNPLQDSIVASAKGKNIHLQITPHVGAVGHYRTSSGIAEYTIGTSLRRPLIVSAGNYRPGQTTSIRAHLQGPGTIDVKADNHSPDRLSGDDS